MRAKRRQKKNRMERTSSCKPEVESAFNLISQENIEELKEFILDEGNEIWNLKRLEDLTILHNACAMDKQKLVEIIIEYTKKRLKIDKNNNTLSNEEKKIMKKFLKIS